MGAAAPVCALPLSDQLVFTTISCSEEVDQLLAIQAANAPETLTEQERASQGCDVQHMRSQLLAKELNVRMAEHVLRS